MQHYLNYGYGFPSKLLTAEEFDRVMQQDYTDVDTGKYSLGCVAFTEGECEHDWSSIVLYNIGEVNKYAKMITLSELNKTIAKHAVISDSRKAKFLDLLNTVGLGHYIDKVELIVYSQNC